MLRDDEKATTSTANSSFETPTDPNNNDVIETPQDTNNNEVIETSKDSDDEVIEISSTNPSKNLAKEKPKTLRRGQDHREKHSIFKKSNVIDDVEMGELSIDDIASKYNINRSMVRKIWYTYTYTYTQYLKQAKSKYVQHLYKGLKIL